MGLIYDASDSSAMMSALSANLSAGSAAIEQTQRACTALVDELDGGDLSGEGYAAIGTLFSDVILRCVTDARKELDAIQADLDTYTYQDSKLSPFGVLKEDELVQQLEATKAQRDATKRLIDANNDAAAAVSTVPGLAESLHATNGRLELILNQLEKDVRDLEDRLRALREFNAFTKSLFQGSLAVLASAGGTMSLLNKVISPRGVDIVKLVRGGLTYTDQKLFLGGEKLRVDSRGRVRWGSRKYVYDRFGSPMSPGGKANHLYKNGSRFGARTGARIDTYMQPIKAGATGTLRAHVDDFTGWKDASKLNKVGKGAGLAGIALTVGSNANQYFHDGIQEDDVRDFAIDTGVDLAAAAAAAGTGAAVGSLVLPPLGTVVGALAGVLASLALNGLDLGDGKSAVDLAKDGIKDAWDSLAAKFW
ncbi:hypothetical protein [uncultured Leifsonia sp.]|uniref:hypothetical protein n=1 Tax=uncultured Leifsonia sp. TaxID=340359 RepID=UPI0025E5C4DE|nr:hypothetical protein [uncultured Leifsonia sp.]